MIKLATTDTEIEACYTVMKSLRPHISEQDFLVRVRSQEREGYQLAYLAEANIPVAVAGFRMGLNLAWGRYLYVDDLVSLPERRSRGNGAKLLSWLKALAVSENCEQIHLDSGMQRKDAHRFYKREGMEASGFHFTEILASSVES